MKAIVLPYQEGEFSMTILLPKNNHSLKEVAKQLQNQGLTDILKNATKKHIDLSIPRFEFYNNRNLTSYLSNTKLKPAFTASNGYEKMTKQSIKIQSVIQAAKIKVTESGTIAAAATDANFGLTAIAPNTHTTDFIANRPFLYIIQQTSSRLILFIGEESNPNSNR